MHTFLLPNVHLTQGYFVTCADQSDRATQLQLGSMTRFPPQLIIELACKYEVETFIRMQDKVNMGRLYLASNILQDANGGGVVAI